METKLKLLKQFTILFFSNNMKFICGILKIERIAFDFSKRKFATLRD